MPDNEIPGSKRIGDLTFMPAGSGLMVEWGYQVGKATNAVTGEPGVIFVITEPDGTHRQYRPGAR